MRNVEELSATQICEFLKGTAAVDFAGQSRVEVYAWLKTRLVQQEYFRQDKRRRGFIRAYLCKLTGLSMPQVTRLIGVYRETGDLAARSYRRRRFPAKYTEEDIVLLVEVDRAHERLSGPPTRRIIQREHQQFGKAKFARLGGISVSHLYNLRRSAAYRSRASKFTRTRPAKVSIGERRRPDAQERPGYLRVDTVHQGDWDGAKGVYHINAIDAVAQWEIVGCTPRISEQYLVPVLEGMLHQFPFRILGFHADNGSEFINHTVAKLLNKLLADRGLAYRTTFVIDKEGRIQHIEQGASAVDPTGAVQACSRLGHRRYTQRHK